MRSGEQAGGGWRSFPLHTGKEISKRAPERQAKARARDRSIFEQIPRPTEGQRGREGASVAISK